MSIRSWLTRFRRARDAAVLRRARTQAVETPEEQKLTSGDIESVKADERTVQVTGDTPAESERLAG